MRPRVPTNINEIRTYWSILSSVQGLKASVLMGGVVGGIAFGGLGFLVGYTVANSRWKRLAVRFIAMGISGSTGVLVGSSGMIITSVSTLRDKIRELSMEPVGPITDMIIRTILPSSIVKELEYHEAKED